MNLVGGVRTLSLLFSVLSAHGLEGLSFMFSVSCHWQRGNAAPGEKDSRVARFPTGMCALEPPHQQHGEQALPTFIESLTDTPWKMRHSRQPILQT